MFRFAVPLLAFFASVSALLACPVDPREAPSRSTIYDAIVRGPAPPEVVRSQTAVAIGRTGGHVSPFHANLPRVIAVFQAGGMRHETIAAVLDGQMPAAGAAVKLASRRADPADSCAFIPWTIVPAKPGFDA